MNKYLFLFRGGDVSGRMSPDQFQKHVERWGAWMADLKNREILLDGLPLSSEGRVVKSKGEIISDGPFTEGKEVVGGYLVIQSNSTEHAVDISKECPILEHESGIVEIREIISM